MLVTFCLIKSRVEAAFGDIYRRWSPRFRERGLVMWQQIKIVETKGRRGKGTKTIQWYDIRPNPYEVTPAPAPYEMSRPNPETVTAARPNPYEWAPPVSAAVQMQQVPAAAAVQMKQIQVAVPPGGASQPLVESATCKWAPPVPAAAAVQMRQVPAAVQMEQIQVAVPPGGASQPLVESATCISVDEVFPSLPAMVDIFERDLGIDGKLNVKEAVDRACAELGVDATQGDLIQKAQRCWELLGRPPGGGAGAATRTLRSGAQQSAVEGLDGQAVTDDPCGDGDVLEIAPRVARALEPFHLARGSTLRWAFRVEAYDLGFSLRRRGFMGGGVETDLVEAQRFGAVATFTGEWRADAACQVLAEFDNSYSVLRSKVVRYRFRVEKHPAWALEKPNAPPSGIGRAPHLEARGGFAALSGRGDAATRAPGDAPPDEFRAGDRVEARYRGRAKHFPGTIAEARDEGTYDVRYDDGVLEKRVTADLMILVARGGGGFAATDQILEARGGGFAALSGRGDAATRTFYSKAKQTVVEDFDGQTFADVIGRGGDVFEIPPRVARVAGRFDLPKHGTLRWEFRVEAYDLGFRLLRLQSGGLATDLVDPQRFDGGATVAGEWRADAACQVVAEFGNTHCALSKTVRCRFRMEDS
ncbi:hypothetical protein SO694_00087164 [Aureococcus anophagefferens]|uniref:GOLD domain-containing protein n=1 Tax=Aureococcus anophagefferens TaxID=44056 RepID=A0ABR1G506_AURAN